MTDWIPFEDGRYGVEEALLIAAGGKALLMEKAYIEIFTGRTGIRWLKGGSLIQNLLMVELLEESDSLDILLNLNDEYMYILRNPDIQAGKVFAPDVKSSLKFMPASPWEPLSQEEFGEIRSRLNLYSRTGP